MGKKGIACCVWVIILLCALSSCKVKFDIPEKKMVSILVDMHVSDGIMATRGNFEITQVLDSTRIYIPIIEKHGYTVDDFRAALSQYMKNPKAFESVYGKVITRLKELQKQYAHAADIADKDEDVSQEDKLLQLRSSLNYETSVAGDTILVWW